MAGESAAAMARRVRERAQQAREKAERLEAYADKLEAGAAGEIATAEVLNQLPPPWFAMHDVRWPGRSRANIDHVVVGPGGIFVIDSKNWSGNLALSGGVLRQNGHSREKAVAGAADAGLAVADVIRTYAGTVHPVLCFVGGSGLMGKARDVSVCTTSDLVRFLLIQPTVLDPRQIQDACMRLDAQLAPAATSPLGIPTSRRRRSPKRSQPRRAVRSRQRRKRGPSLLRVLVTGAAVLLAIVMGPQLATGFADHISQVITEQPTSTTECAAPQQGVPARKKKASRPASAKRPATPSRTASCADAGDR